MHWILEEFGGWVIGLVATGIVILVGNAVLWVWHRITRGAEEIAAFYLVADSAVVPRWMGHGVSETSQGGLSIDVPRVLRFLFEGPGATLGAKLGEKLKATKTCALLVAPAGVAVNSAQEAMTLAVSAARASVPLDSLRKARAYAFESQNLRAGRAFVVIVGRMPGEPPQLELG